VLKGNTNLGMFLKSMTSLRGAFSKHTNNKKRPNEEGFFNVFVFGSCPNILKDKYKNEA
jgi:hypothetical protein